MQKPTKRRRGNPAFAHGKPSGNPYGRRGKPKAAKPDPKPEPMQVAAARSDDETATTPEQWAAFARRAIEQQALDQRERDKWSAVAQSEIDERAFKRHATYSRVGVAFDRDGVPRWVNDGSPVLGSRRRLGGGGWR